ncbi:hypothetical protein KM043_011244 [Ampulex compressa]|nr:hypothetical protein KM043_011244 [Ampulex compressa]
MNRVMTMQLQKETNRCGTIVKRLALQERATVADDTPTRLYSTWLSQECEVRTGPEYMIRKYRFFENGTFSLLRYYYAEESCSLATHTVVAHGTIQILLPSTMIPGTTEAKVYLDRVYLIPLNRQVAHKYRHKVNISCGPQPKWRPYMAQMIYEQQVYRSSILERYGPTYNSLQIYPTLRKQRSINCLEALGIEFSELELLRVQKRMFDVRFVALEQNYRPKVELLLGDYAKNSGLQKTTRKPTFLQSTSLLRIDTVSECPICGTIARGTEYSPPLLHEAAALPALIGGLWLSLACESIEGGFWSKRLFRIHSADRLWTGRWDYYVDPKCSTLFYTVTAAGSYVQRTMGQHNRRIDNDQSYENHFNNIPEMNDPRINVEENITSTTTYPPNSNLENTRSTRSSREPRSKFDNVFPHYLNISRRSWSINERKLNLPKKILQTIHDTESVDKSARRSLVSKREKRNLEGSIYRHILQNTETSMADSFVAMLRSNRGEENNKKKSSFVLGGLSGSTELDLHVAESTLIPGNSAVARRCGFRETVKSSLLRISLSSWPRNCVPRTVEAPSTLGLKAKLSMDWSGYYILLLGPRDDDPWNPPLRRCSGVPPRNPFLKAHLRRSIGIRYGLLSSASSSFSISMIVKSLSLAMLMLILPIL